MQASDPSMNGVKPRTLLTNGLIIGVGLALTLICLFAIIALNNVSANISAILSNSGVSASGIRAFLGGIVSLIALSYAGIILGSYLLLIGMLNQFSTRARLAWERKDKLSRAANGLLGGGVVFASLSALYLIQQQSYTYSIGWFASLLQILLVIGFVMMAIGVILLLARKPVSQQD